MILTPIQYSLIDRSIEIKLSAQTRKHYKISQQVTDYTIFDNLSINLKFTDEDAKLINTLAHKQITTNYNQY